MQGALCLQHLSSYLVVVVVLVRFGVLVDPFCHANNNFMHADEHDTETYLSRHRPSNGPLSHVISFAKIEMTMDFIQLTIKKILVIAKYTLLVKMIQNH